MEAVSAVLCGLAGITKSCAFIIPHSSTTLISRTGNGIGSTSTSTCTSTSRSNVWHRRAPSRLRLLRGAQQEGGPDLPQIKRPVERQFISILSGDGTEQMLPVSSASRFPLWVIDSVGTRSTSDAQGAGVVQVPGADSESGWVDPISYEELWVPQGSPAPTMTLCLGMLMKDGVPRYAMPMVDLVVRKGDDKWRNRGLKSVPLSHCWETVARVAGGALTLSAYVEEKVEGSETDTMWGALVEKVSVKDAFTDLVGVLADPPEGLHIEEGFHFLVAQIPSIRAFPVPKAGGRVRVFLSDAPQPADMLEVSNLRGVAELGFDIIDVANAGESDFLPEVYRSLFSS